jgi:general secretion pathway protein G
MIERLQAKRNEGGFTLIELLIVIIVLGILAAIVVFAVSSTKHDSVAASCKTDVKSIELSAEGVNTHTGSYPAGPINSQNDSALLSSGTNGALLKSWPSTSNYVMQYTLSGGSPLVKVFPKGTFEKNDGTMYTDAAFSAPATALSGCDDSSL